MDHLGSLTHFPFHFFSWLPILLDAQRHPHPPRPSIPCAACPGQARQSRSAFNYSFLSLPRSTRAGYCIFNTLQRDQRWVWVQGEPAKLTKPSRGTRGRGVGWLVASQAQMLQSQPADQNKTLENSKRGKKGRFGVGGAPHPRGGMPPNSGDPPGSPRRATSPVIREITQSEGTIYDAPNNHREIIYKIKTGVCFPAPSRYKVEAGRASPRASRG